MALTIFNILFLSDTHLGYDMPVRPRIHRRRRGNDFFRNYDLAVQAAFEIRADLVLHGGDFFYRSKIPKSLLYKGFENILRLADSGIPVLIVPGNHDRSMLPNSLFTNHKNIYIFHQPETFLFKKENISLAFAGFPFVRGNIRDKFESVVESTGWGRVQADQYFLCLHQIFEGARVGPSGYRFQYGDQVIRAANVPAEFTAVLSGHIHRQQVLEKNGIHAPVIYPGSTERTSFAEMTETKGFMRLQAGKDFFTFSFNPLPAREMKQIQIFPDGRSPGLIRKEILEQINACDTEDILRIVIHGNLPAALIDRLTVKNLRKLSPPDMNLYLSFRQ